MFKENAIVIKRRLFDFYNLELLSKTFKKKLSRCGEGENAYLLNYLNNLETKLNGT